MCVILISKAFRLTHAIEGSQFYLPPTRLSRYGMSDAAFTPQLQSVTTLWPILISHPIEGRRLSWPG